MDSGIGTGIGTDGGGGGGYAGGVGATGRDDAAGKVWRCPPNDCWKWCLPTDQQIEWLFCLAICSNCSVRCHYHYRRCILQSLVIRMAWFGIIEKPSASHTTANASTLWAQTNKMIRPWEVQSNLCQSGKVAILLKMSHLNSFRYQSILAEMTLGFDMPATRVKCDRRHHAVSVYMVIRLSTSSTFTIWCPGGNFHFPSWNIEI